MIGIVPPERTSSGRTPSACSNASGRAESPARRAARDPAACPSTSISSSAPAGAASRISRSAAAPTVSTSCPGARRIVHSPDACTAERRVPEAGLAADDPVHVARRLGERPDVELLAARGSSGRAPWPRALSAPGGSAAQSRAPPPSATRCPARSGSGRQAVRPGEHRAEAAHQHVDRVERSAAVHPGVEVALAGLDLDVERDQAASREIEHRQVAAQHPAVEDDRRVCADVVDARSSRRSSCRRSPPRRRRRSAG